MATVPGVLIVGDYSVQGGEPGMTSAVSAFGVSDIQYGRHDRVMRVLPDNIATGAPTAAALNWYPWFDGGAAPTLHNVASATSTTVTVAPNPGWAVHEHVGRLVTNPNAFGLGFKNRRVVTANTSDTITVSVAWTVNPAAPEAIFLGIGRWRDYHAIAGWLATPEIGSSISTRGGSSWQANGQGIGPDAGLLRELLESVWPVSPYFQVAKYALVASTHTAFDDATGIQRANFVAEKARYDAAWTALANGNTLQWQYLILDLSCRDVLSWVGSPANFLQYQAKLAQTIAWFRATLGNANLRVVLVNHDPVINNVAAPTGTALANGVHRQIAAEDTLVRCCSLEGVDKYLAIPYAPNQNRAFYDAPAYWGEIPRRMRQTIQIFDVAANNVTAALPAYVLIGDSIGAGEINSPWLTALNSPTITIGTRDSRQKIWNRLLQQVESYSACVNSNTSGTANANAGPECSLMVELMNRHPVTGFVLIKRAANSSALAALLTPYSSGQGGRWAKAHAGTEHYGEMLTDMRHALNHAHAVLGRQLDLKAVLVTLGTNDGAVAGGGDLFAAALPAFVQDLRQDLSTRTSGEALPVIWRQPQLGTATAIFDEMTKVRTALQSLADQDEQFRLVDVDDLQRKASDNLHETPEACIAHGQRLALSLDVAAI